jgi:hypothetical protein
MSEVSVAIFGSPIKLLKIPKQLPSSTNNLLKLINLLNFPIFDPEILQLVILIIVKLCIIELLILNWLQSIIENIPIFDSQSIS